jgi:hypothetical protein
MKNELPEEIEIFRDQKWRRSPDLRVENGIDAESLIEEAGFCAALTDARRGGPSIYIAVCGRRDAHMPRNVQKDPEASLAWVIKDEVMKRGRVYYAKLAKNRATFLARRLIPHFNALWGIARKEEANRLSDEARAILKVLRKEWEMATCDLRMESGIADRARFTRAMDELQAAMKVIPADVLYEPYFTYIWTLPEGRFAEELKVKVKRDVALKEIARAFLDGAGMTLRGELARITGLSRPDAGRGNQMLVKEGYTEQIDVGVYRLKDFEKKAVESAQWAVGS